MDWRLFTSTFALIFLAELGDKTQLASFAASASTRSPLSIFAGSAAALVLSSLIAVLAGTFLQKFIPQYLIKGVAAVLFLVFGVLLLFNAIQTRHEKPAVYQVAPRGVLARVALQAASQFERAASEDYMRLAQETINSDLKSLFIHLASEEKTHLDKVLSVTEKQKPEEVIATVEQAPTVCGRIVIDEAVASILDTAIRHEKDTVNFYRALADSAVVPEIKQSFSLLAQEEQTHVAHLEEFKATGITDIHRKHS